MKFKDFKKFNIACLAKQYCHLLQNPSSLWTQLLKDVFSSLFYMRCTSLEVMFLDLARDIGW